MDLTIDDLIAQLTEIKKRYGNLIVTTQDGEKNIFPPSVTADIIENVNYNTSGYYEMVKDATGKIVCIRWSA